MIRYDEFYPATFIGVKEYGGFKNKLNYTVKVDDNKPYGVILTVLGDGDFSRRVPYCNLKSIERVWKINEQI